jgi:hypothetical protein
MTGVVLADVPVISPIADAVGGAIGNVASSGARAMFEFFMTRFAELLADSAKKVSDELVHYLGASTGVNLDSGWFAGPRAKEILSVVAAAAGVFLVLFLLLAVLQGLLQGDVTMMMRAAFLEVPASVFGMLVLFVGAGALLGITDALSAAVLSTAPESLGRFFVGFTQGPQIVALGFIGLLGTLMFILASIFLYVELMVRAGLIYLLAAASWLALAARVWPQLRGVWHSFLRLGVALIVSKFIVALALALGAAALGGGGPQGGDAGTQAGLSVQGVILGVTLMSLASFAPFLVLKVIPLFEAALVAQGISRGPVRAAQTGLQGAYYAKGLQRLAGGSGGGGGRNEGAKPASSGDSSSPSGGGSGSNGGGASASGGLGGGGAAAAPASGGAAAGAGSGGAAAAGPAGAAAVPVGAAKVLAGKAKSSAAEADRA